jgi:hypothetical protein
LTPDDVRQWLRSFAEYLALHGKIEPEDVDYWTDHYCADDPDFALLEEVSREDYSDEAEE